MFVDLTCMVSDDNPVMLWAKSQAQQHAAMGHVGTHLDTYEKTTIPLEYVKSSAYCFDVYNMQEIKLEDIDINQVRSGDFVMFRTGQISKHPYGTPEYFHNHPQLSLALIQALIDKKVRFIGIDAAGIRQHAEHEAADRLCEQNGIYVIENLCRLSEVVGKRFTAFCLWFEDDKMTGLKTRVLAEI